MSAKTVTVQIHREGSICYIPIPFDPKRVFGKVRAPLRVTLNGYTYHTTIAKMGGVCCVPLRRSNREAARLSGDETLAVTFELDTAIREVSLPPELAAELSSNPHFAIAWHRLSYTDRREHVESIDSAKRADTRARRAAKIIADLGAH